MLNADFIISNLVSDISFNQADDNKFVISLKSNITKIFYDYSVNQGVVDWSEIPAFLKEFKFTQQSVHGSLQIDLSSFDTSSKMHCLEINLKYGSVLLPDYPFPQSLILLSFHLLR